MKIDLSAINWDVLAVIFKWGIVVAAITAIYFGIKESGRIEEKLVTTQEKVKTVEKKNEVKNEVHQVINRVVVDPDYRERVRERYDGNAK